MRNSKGQFEKGITPHNKGKKYPNLHHDKQFKKGHTPYNKGQKRPKEIGQKIGDALRGRKKSEAIKAKMKEEMILRYKNGFNPVLGKHWKLEDVSHLQGENSASWKGGKPKCLVCQKQLTNYDAKRCTQHAKSGELHPQWIADRTKLAKRQERNDSLYREVTSQAKKRDGACKLFNENCRGYLIVHHILGWTAYPEERYNLNNLITLCQGHHPRKRTEEKRLVPVFQNLLINTH